MFTKVQQQDLEGKGVVGQATVPGLSVREMQESVEQIVREVAIPAINRLIEELAQPQAAQSIGAQVPELQEGENGTLQAVLDVLREYVQNHAADRDNPHEVTAGQTGAYTKQETDQRIDLKVADIGAGDMAKAVYDADDDGVVDRADTARRVESGFLVQDAAGGTLTSFDGAEEKVLKLTKAAVGLSKASNTADSEKEVLSAQRLRVQSVSAITGLSQSGIYYYPRNTASAPTTDDGLLFNLFIGLFGAQLAVPTTGNHLYFRSGSSYFPEWKKLTE